MTEHIQPAHDIPESAAIGTDTIQDITLQVHDMLTKSEPSDIRIAVSDMLVTAGQLPLEEGETRRTMKIVDSEGNESEQVVIVDPEGDFGTVVRSAQEMGIDGFDTADDAHDKEPTATVNEALGDLALHSAEIAVAAPETVQDVGAALDELSLAGKINQGLESRLGETPRQSEAEESTPEATAVSQVELEKALRVFDSFKHMADESVRAMRMLHDGAGDPRQHMDTLDRLWQDLYSKFGSHTGDTVVDYNLDYINSIQAEFQRQKGILRQRYEEHGPQSHEFVSWVNSMNSQVVGNMIDMKRRLEQMEQR